jgi:TFIIF-interacting CTD phosphatase-like protein
MMGDVLDGSAVKKRKLLVLDLDETLIHSAYTPIEGAELKARRGYFHLYERPYLKEFLHRCSAENDLAIWSASKADYVRWIIRSTVLSEYSFVFINTRKNCKRIFGNGGRVDYLKDLTAYMPQYEKVIILDDVPKMVTPIECCIKAPEFRGGVDEFLMNLGC